MASEFPTVQAKLSVPNLDALREMIARDYAGLVEAYDRASVDARMALFITINRVENLANIFSVVLPKR